VRFVRRRLRYAGCQRDWHKHGCGQCAMSLHACIRVYNVCVCVSMCVFRGKGAGVSVLPWPHGSQSCPRRRLDAPRPWLLPVTSSRCRPHPAPPNTHHRHKTASGQASPSCALLLLLLLLLLYCLLLLVRRPWPAPSAAMFPGGAGIAVRRLCHVIGQAAQPQDVTAAAVVGASLSGEGKGAWMWPGGRKAANNRTAAGRW
jgi:hypothetical protein